MGSGIIYEIQRLYLLIPYYWEFTIQQDKDLGEILEEHFKRLSDEEYSELI